MSRLLLASRRYVSLLLCMMTVIAGCRSHGVQLEQAPITSPPVTRQIETPITYEPPAEVATNITVPLTVNTDEAPIDWILGLEEAVQITMANSDVIRDIGGRVVQTPQTTSSVYDAAIQEMDPQFGVEAALSAFDTQVATSLLFNRDERSLNNLFFGGGALSLHSNTAAYRSEISKQSATGTRYAVRNIIDYDRNSSPANLFPSAYSALTEAEFRHPLLRGNGLEFNRIAGPNSRPGIYNGVVLARIRTDIALADFEASVRNLIRDVETAYWQLYFAYRTLDARKAAYEAALNSWRTVQDQVEAGTEDGEREALARANYYQIKASVQNALSGSSNGIVGVYAAERTLRQLMGIPANDGRLIRPADEPSVAKQIFDWQDSVELAMERRVELRRQRWTVKQRENELVAARNFLLSQIDLIGLYRWRGFGDDLLGNRDVANGSAISDLWGGDLQGWQLGLQYSTTLGKRQEHAAVRAAELQLARERSLLRNQELTISSELSGQYAELDRTYEVTKANFNRSIAERQRLEAAMAKYDAGEVLLEFVLQSQQSTADADSEYYRTLVDYNLAVANMHYARGSYLDFMGVSLSEGPWSPDAYRSYRKEFRRFKPRMNYCMMEPCGVSSGPFSQSVPQVLTDDFVGGEPVPAELGFDVPARVEAYGPNDRAFMTSVPAEPAMAAFD